MCTLTDFYWALESDALSYLLMPGAICAHAIIAGSSKLQHTIAAVLEFTVNWIIYTTAIALLLLLSKSPRSKEQKVEK